jgi:iron complex outermembrane receptor protein
LQPEKSKNLSAGVVFTPSPRLTVTLDYYNIKVQDRIGTTAEIDVLPADRPILRDRGVETWATLGRVRFMTNGFTTRTNGVDLVVTHNLPTGFGSFMTTFVGNYNKTKVVNIEDTVTQDGRRFPLLNAIASGNLEDLYPKWRATLTENWTLDQFSLMARARYYGSYAHRSTAGRATFGAEFMFDLAASYTFMERFTATIGAENVLDNYPDRETRGIYPLTNTTANGQYYMTDSAVSWQGAFVYARLAVRF